MSFTLSKVLLEQIHTHAAASYPEEGAGFVLGRLEGEERVGLALHLAPNLREQAARARRYLLDPREFLRAEQAAEAKGLELIAIFHSHPDHPNVPSEFDREWALPWFSYLITSVRDGQATETRSWRLADARIQFVEEPIILKE
ncbi:MAG: M67 family metallopeptidase [Anaerolineales bacterium]|nr:M67 family metallopeptidase [Anaerolineales bacterium]